MIEFLYEKFINHKKELLNGKKSQFNGDEYQMFQFYFIEEIPNGTILYKSSQITMFLNDGTIYKLMEHQQDDTYQFYTLLNNLSHTCGNFKVEKLVSYEVKTIENNIFSLIIVQRPFPNIGYSRFQDILDNKVNTNYMMKYVDDTSVILPHLKNINHTMGLQLPSTLIKQISFDDDVCWADIKNLCLTYDGYTKICLHELYRDVNTYKNMFKIDLDVKLIMDTADKLWT